MKKAVKKTVKKVELPGDLGLRPIKPEFEIRIEYSDGSISIEDPDGAIIAFDINKSEAKQIGEWFLQLSAALPEGE